MRRALPLLAAVVATSPVAPAFADIAFPARLDVAEASPGRFQVSFTLPIVEGRKLRAVPVLPRACRDVTARETSASYAGYHLKWAVRCEPPSLTGEAILVEGLLGTQTDLAFSLTTLDGRVYSEILRPSRPGFVVPEPPSIPELAAEAVIAGMRRTLRAAPLWLLLTTVTLLGARWRELATGVGAFAAAHSLGQWLGGNGWLGVQPLERDLFVLATVAVPCVALAGAGDRWRGWARPLWPIAASGGLLYAGAAPEALPPDGLSRAEQSLALVFLSFGVALALLLVAAAARELDAALRLASAGRWHARGRRWLGYAVGSLATGMLLARLAGLALLSSDGRGTPLELWLLAAVLGASAARTGRSPALTAPAFAALAGGGVALGLARVPVPLGSTLALGSLLLLGTALAARRTMPARWLGTAAVVAVPAHAWLAARTLVENVSRSSAAAVGAALVATCVFYAARRAVPADRADDAGAIGAADRTDSSVQPSASPVPAGLRLLGGTAAAFSVVSRLGEYTDWLDRQVATEAALGLARVPLLALALALVAVIAWPRRRRVLEELGVASRPRAAHWLLIGAAWLLLPYGTLAVRNPLFEAEAPRGEAARRVAASVLSDTYRAFNIEDENALYDSLARSVTGDLVDDLYLDSRRRLTAGTRQGARVTVRDVSVLEIGDPAGGGSAAQGLAYACRWVVTARVQHLQHVHHRRNVYDGVLTLRIDGDRWKIAGVELRSEEREVVPWTPV